MSKREYYKKRPIIGSVEEITVRTKEKDGGEARVLARIDTGAVMSSICESLAKRIGLGKVVKEMAKVKDIINYPAKNNFKEKKLLKKIKGVIDTVLVISSHGRTRRVVVPIKMKIAGKYISTKVTIIERTGLEYPAIIGRRDLKNFLIDTSRHR